ncbi:MAG: hypothetical protein H0W10_08240, partial [Chloroflexi bacterium]|nr:hypothetical protein [Chloroflexota bacterium]
GQRWSDGAWCRAARWASWSPGLGLSAGAIDSKIYSVVVGMAIITTLMVPPLLPMLVRRAERNAEPAGDDGPNL